MMGCKDAEKPWDKIREAPVVKKGLIAEGEWVTSEGAAVKASRVSYRDVRLAITGYYFGPKSLRELAEFCEELASQLES